MSKILRIDEQGAILEQLVYDERHSEPEHDRYEYVEHIPPLGRDLSD